MRRAPAAPLSRLLLRSVAAALAGAALLAGLVIGLVQLPVTATAAAAGSSAISLVDDDGGAALFPAVQLSPGRPRTACVGLSARGSVDPTTEVRLSADLRTGDLSRYLTVAVDRGSVPAGGSCAAFAGERIWTGTLAELPGPDVAGIRTGWRPALAQRSVYRITVTLLDDVRAQGLTASASFRWSLTEAIPDPVPEPSPEPSPEPLPEPAPAPAAATPTSEAPASAAPTSAAPTSAAPAPSDPGGSGATDVVEAPPLASGPVAAVAAAAQAAVQAVTEAVTQAAQQVGQTAVAVAHDGQFPVALVAVVGAFLFLQGRLDRRDPKLALARVREELSEYRDFPRPPTTETT